MSPTRSRRARAACGLSVAAGFFTVPLWVVLIVVGTLAPDLGPLGNWLVQEATAWAGAALALALATAGFVLGWRHRRDIEVHGAPPVDAGLARAGEILGAVVGLVAVALLYGVLKMRWGL